MDRFLTVFIVTWKLTSGFPLIVIFCSLRYLSPHPARTPPPAMSTLSVVRSSTSVY
ncbi:hypothetical protein BCR44DRAFT_1442850 [Catenaria anguillulae PL171]|uniref:Uncharacterized protein n=1 Tax=Catenaria anguillulae PL171 TaxID=765915 RepID=A0A1Y2H9J5_9FUNG|nr:hypothetical protein BCR44DRAFT_1442850 [Catenaria anguillulae PL171]